MAGSATVASYSLRHADHLADRSYVGSAVARNAYAVQYRSVGMFPMCVWVGGLVGVRMDE